MSKGYTFEKNRFIIRQSNALPDVFSLYDTKLNKHVIKRVIVYDFRGVLSNESNYIAINYNTLYKLEENKEGEIEAKNIFSIDETGQSCILGLGLVRNVNNYFASYSEKNDWIILYEVIDNKVVELFKIKGSLFDIFNILNTNQQTIDEIKMKCLLDGSLI